MCQFFFFFFFPSVGKANSENVPVFKRLSHTWNYKSGIVQDKTRPTLDTQVRNHHLLSNGTIFGVNSWVIKWFSFCRKRCTLIKSTSFPLLATRSNKIFPFPMDLMNKKCKRTTGHSTYFPNKDHGKYFDVQQICLNYLWIHRF